MRGDILIINENHRKAARQVVDIIFYKIKSKKGKFVISVAGESGAGKSEIAASIAEVLAEKNISCFIFQQDDYFVNKIKKPLVIFEEDRIDKETVNLENVKVIIVEGTYTTTLQNIDQRIFIDRDLNDTRESRKKRNREKQDEFLEVILLIENKIIMMQNLQTVNWEWIIINFDLFSGN
jgi:uridine kinase